MMLKIDGLGCVCFKYTILVNLRTGIQDKLLTKEVSPVTMRKKKLYSLLINVFFHFAGTLKPH